MSALRLGRLPCDACRERRDLGALECTPQCTFLRPAPAGAAEQLAVAALQCAEAWLALTPVAGSGCAFTPAQLQAQQGPLLGAALALVAGPASGEAAVEAAVQLLLLVFGPENFSPDEQADLAATSALVAALLASRGRLGGADGDTLPAGVAKLAAAAAERAPEFVCGSMPEAAALAELVLECLGRPGPEMAAHAVDFLLMANTGGWPLGGVAASAAWAQAARAPFAGGCPASRPAALPPLPAHLSCSAAGRPARGAAGAAVRGGAAGGGAPRLLPPWLHLLGRGV